MTVKMISPQAWVFCLLLHGLAAAYPADSLLLTQITSIGTLSDTLEVKKFTYSRDNQGSWHETTADYRRDTLRSMKFKTYDVQGLAVAESSLTARANGDSLKLTTRTVHDAAGRPINATLIENDSLVYTYAYEYDAAGKLQKWTISTATPAFATYYLYTYNAQGLPLDKKRYVGDTVKEATRNFYNGNSRLVSTLMFNAKGDTTERISIEYDTAGRISREITTFPDSLSLLNIDKRTAYAGNGNVIAVTWYGKSGYLQSTDAYAYRSVNVPLAVLAYRTRHGISSESGGWGRSGESGWTALGRRLTFRKSDLERAHGRPGPLLAYPSSGQAGF